MLEKLQLRNFQRHARLDLDLDQLVTVLVGRSDCGKTAVLRALRWLATNRPAGTAFVCHGRRRAAVRLVFDSGRTAVRTRGPGRNDLQLDGRRFAALGTAVPDNLATALNLGPVNWQLQHDPPFWLALSPGEASRELNAVVDLGLIDRVLGAAAAQARRAQADVDAAAARLQQARQRVKELAWVVEADKALAAVEEQYTNVNLYLSRAAQITEVLQRVQEATRHRDLAATTALALAKPIALAQRALELADRAAKLRSVLQNITKKRAALVEARQRRKVAEYDLREATKGRCPVCLRPWKGIAGEQAKS